MNDLKTRSLQGPILMLWEPRSFHCSPYCVPDEILDRWIHDLTTSGSPDAVLDAWREMGVTQLLVNHQGAALVAPDTSDILLKPGRRWKHCWLGSLTLWIMAVFTLYTGSPHETALDLSPVLRPGCACFWDRRCLSNRGWVYGRRLLFPWRPSPGAGFWFY